MQFVFNTNIRYKTILMFLVSMLSIIFFLVIVFYTSIEKIIQDDYASTLQLKNNIVAQLHIDELQAQNPEDKIIKDAYRNENSLMLNRRDYVFDIQKFNARQIADSLRLPLAFVQQILNIGESSHQDDSFQYVGKNYKSPDYNFIVVTSAENYFTRHIRAHLQQILIASLFIALIITFLISYYLSRNLFKPINKIMNRVKEISSLNLHYRLEEEKYNKELNQLIQTFNDMLTRIETSFESQNNFISNASHELRTPLTSIIGAADVSLSKPRRPEEYMDTLTIILNEAEKLDRKTKALLSLAQTGFNGKAQRFDSVRIDELLWDCIATIQSLDQNAKIHFDISLIPDNSSKLIITGNEQLLHLGFTNLIMNACKYSDNQLVKVSIGATHSKVVIIVQDSGIGIPRDEQDYIFDPFYRCSNTKKYEGYGIGLPLTRNIVKMHQGKIVINSSENAGTVVEVHLPIK